MQKFLSLFFILWCNSILFAQEDYSITHLTAHDGLSQGMIFDIIQSKDGFIWIGTKDGLNRYDGSRFEVFAPDPYNPFSISQGEVRKLFEDSRGWIWLILPNGVDVLDPKKGLFYHFKHKANAIIGKEGESIAESADGVIWLTNKDQFWRINVTSDLLKNSFAQGVSTIEPAHKVYNINEVSDQKADDLILEQLFFTREQKLIVRTNQGLSRFDPATEKLVSGIEEEESLNSVFSGDRTQNKQALPKSTIEDYWIWCFGAGTRVFSELLGFGLYHFVFTDNETIWIFRNRHLQKWKVTALFGNGKPELEIDPSVDIDKELITCTKLLKDKSGVFWIGTHGYGLLKIHMVERKFSNPLNNIAQRRLLEAPKGGIYSLNNPTIQYTSKSFTTHVPNTDFYFNLGKEKFFAWYELDACFDSFGNGWAFNRNKGEMYRKDAMTNSIKTYKWSGLNSGLIIDHSGNVLSVNENGLIKLDTKGETVSEFPFNRPQKLSTVFSYFLYEAVDHVIWIYGYEGLIKATPKDSGFEFSNYTNIPTNRNSLSSDIVHCVVDDPIEPAKYLWIGTKNGLNRLDKRTNEFKLFKKEDGLPDHVIYGILPENRSDAGSGDHIWLSSNNGLCRFHVRSETAKNFTVQDGLQDSEFNSSSYLKLKDGTMLFGGVKGVTLFHPDSLRFNEHLPQVHIVGLKVNNHSFDLQGRDNIILSHDQNSLSFDFAALEFTDPSQNQYQYQLVGVDKTWIPLGTQNSIQFANLSPGPYTIRVKGSNNDGRWSEQIAELRFHIQPPWWATGWAYFMYLALLAGLVRYYYQFKIRQNHQDQETLRLREMDEFKSRFFTNITHEFRTPLTVILGMSDQLDQLEPDAHKKKKIGLIRRNGDNLLRLINQILDLSKIESKTFKLEYVNGDILAYLRYIAESLHSLANGQNVMLKVISEQTKIEMDFDPDRILQILYNLLSNAIKFTPSGGKVILHADVIDAYLHISVEDTGAGIPAEDIPFLFDRFFQANNQKQSKEGGTGIGLALTREIVKAMHGEIFVESHVGRGTKFTIHLPITQDASKDNRFYKPGTFASKAAVDPSAISSADPAGYTISDDLEISTPHILLIEDNPDVVEYLSSCLQKNYHLEYAFNGEAGIQKAVESVPDIIVSDVMMPVKDGFEVLEAVKHHESTDHIPIVLLTAKADIQSRLTGIKKGADAYLAKPFHQDELNAVIENLLANRRKLQEKYQKQILPHPDAPGMVAEGPEDPFLSKVKAVIDQYYADEEFGLNQLCQKIGMSRSQLFRKLKALSDMAPSDLIRKHRLNKAKLLLEMDHANVSEAAWKTGFKDPSYFSKLFQEEFGFPPGSLRK